MKETPSSEIVSTRLHKIAKLAREAPELVLTTLAHSVDVDFLREAYSRIRKDGAAGVDGETAEEYEKDLEGNFLTLMNRFKGGTYKAPPVRRVHIPKAGTDKTRPIGIPTLEDKLLQKAVGMILESIYEQDFLPCSYGYRPNKSQHMALEQIWKATMDVKGGWVLEADIQDYFGTLNHVQLRSFLDQRVRDGVIRRAIDKWLKAGVMEEGNVSYPESGTPQGGVISPILSNIYLHEVLDKWFEEEVKPRLKGRARLVRFADDFVCIFDRLEDAEAVMRVLPKRFEKYGLSLHPEKTRLVDFRKPTDPPDSGKGGPDGFNFLGLHHHWGKSKAGKWCVRQKTSKNRLSRAIRRVMEWCRENRHESLREQRKALIAKLRGHDNYYGVTGNYRAIGRFHHMVKFAWFKWLNRRSQKKSMTWEQFHQYLARNPLPNPRLYASALK